MIEHLIGFDGSRDDSAVVVAERDTRDGQWRYTIHPDPAPAPQWPGPAAAEHRPAAPVNWRETVQGWFDHYAAEGSFQLIPWQAELLSRSFEEAVRDGRVLLTTTIL